MKELEKLRAELAEALADALRVYEANKAGGSPALSVAFDSGRYDGLKQALAIIDKALGGLK